MKKGQSLELGRCEIESWLCLSLAGDLENRPGLFEPQIQVLVIQFSPPGGTSSLLSPQGTAAFSLCTHCLWAWLLATCWPREAGPGQPMASCSGSPPPLAPPYGPCLGPTGARCPLREGEDEKWFSSHWRHLSLLPCPSLCSLRARSSRSRTSSENSPTF